MKTKAYKLGTEFPHEGFVQAAIESHFSKLGFIFDTQTQADLMCAHSESGERWLIEAKGMTSDCGLDFRTGLGQVLQRMTDDSVKYAIAIPEVERFLNQCRAVSKWTRERLGLHWLIIREDGSIRVVTPDEIL